VLGVRKQAKTGVAPSVLDAWDLAPGDDRRRQAGGQADRDGVEGDEGGAVWCGVVQFRRRGTNRLPVIYLAASLTPRRPIVLAVGLVLAALA